MADKGKTQQHSESADLRQGHAANGRNNPKSRSVARLHCGENSVINSPIRFQIRMNSKS